MRYEAQCLLVKPRANVTYTAVYFFWDILYESLNLVFKFNDNENGRLGKGLDRDGMAKFIGSFFSPGYFSHMTVKLLFSISAYNT